jgi:hypothetical protein
VARLVRDITAGDASVVVWPDRHARSVGHLLTVIEQPTVKDAYFHSLWDPIDTITPNRPARRRSGGHPSGLFNAFNRLRKKCKLALKWDPGQVRPKSLIIL